MKPATPPCHATVAHQPDGSYAISVELTNAGDQPVTLESYQPFLQFRVRAEADGAPVTIDQPALDLPVQPIDLTIPARGSLTLRSPIRLVIAAGARGAKDGFVWTIARPATGLTLAIDVDLAAPYGGPCSTDLVGP